MRFVPWWALLSSVAAPLTLVGGWTVAAALQPPGYNPVTQTISSLAAHGAADRWVMTLALLLLGLCHLVTALGLRNAALGGRIALACGGAATLVVALSPEPPGSASVRHMAATGLGFTALAVWPRLAVAGDRAAVPWPLKPSAGIAVTVALLLGAGWFLLALHGHGAAGAVERVLTAAQALWPLAVVAASRIGAPRMQTQRADRVGTSS